MNMFEKLKKDLNYKLVNWQMKKGHSVLFGKPFSLVLDTSSLCNLECVWCPTGQKRNSRTQCIMPYDKVIDIFDKLGPYLKKVMLCNWGEPLLNKDLIKEITYIKTKYDFHLILSSNLNTQLSQEDAENLINSGIDVLICSIDGATQNTYEKYRRKGCLNTALENLKLLIKSKRKYKKKSPYIVWQYLVFKHNEHEISKAKEMANDIGVDNIHFVKPWCPEDWISTLPEYSNYIINEKEKKEYKNITKHCYCLWTTIVINANGSVSPCCSVEDEKNDFGNFFNQSLFKLWNNKNYRVARKYNITRKKNNINNICVACDHIGTCPDPCK